jgi:predicted metal-dependent hydrolase
MKASVFLLFVSILVFACSSNENKKAQGPNWTDYSKNTFLRECTNRAKEKMDSTKAAEYCTCIMGQMIAAHPDTTELDKMGQEKIKSESMRMAIKCLF